MKALTINPATKEIEEIDIEMKANTVYSFFNSILIDELSSLNQHIVYCDANALTEGKAPYFLGEQLLIGDALIIGRSGMEEIDAQIPQAELQKVISHEVNTFYQESLALLAQSDINLYRTFEIQQEGEALHLNTEWVLYTFNMADERTKEYFLIELQKALDVNKDITVHVQKMAQLAINAAG
ncbi:MAG: hypothetical protein ABFR02_07060 [Campylobacterota bacterium]